MQRGPQQTHNPKGSLIFWHVMSSNSIFTSG